MNYVHWLKYLPNQSWTKVTKEEWLEAEHNAGFRAKRDCGPYATGGFGNGTISGALTLDNNPPI